MLSGVAISVSIGWAIRIRANGWSGCKALTAEFCRERTLIRMMDQDLPGEGPFCPQCGRELDAEPALAGHALSVAYACRDHGVIVVSDPFDAAIRLE
jgi:hypothetical protein